jgi:hypothetical protein
MARAHVTVGSVVPLEEWRVRVRVRVRVRGVRDGRIGSAAREVEGRGGVARMRCEGRALGAPARDREDACHI